MKINGSIIIILYTITFTNHLQIKWDNAEVLRELKLIHAVVTKLVSHCIESLSETMGNAITSV
jgi:hypothetical protein